MSSQLITFAPNQNQVLSAQLTVNAQALTLNFTLTYSAMAGYWQLAVADASNVLLIASVPLITGLYPAANLLAQYEYLQIGEAYLLNTSVSPLDFPGQYTLPQFSLLWSDNT